MPQFLEDRLKAEAAAKGMTGDQADRYVYGGMNNLGYMRGNMETSAGRAVQAKHVRQVKAGTAQPAPTMSSTTLPHPHRNLGNYLHPPAAKLSRATARVARPRIRKPR